VSRFFVDSAKFSSARDQVLASGGEKAGIGTLGEGTLHAVLKLYLEPFSENREIPLGRYVADIVGEDGVVEIQTRSFRKLLPKLRAFLEVTTVTVVYPVARTKWLAWLDPETGEMSKAHKSPKRGTAHDIFYELYDIKPLLSNPNLRFCVVLLDIDEYRILNGWSKNRKRGGARMDRVPRELVETVEIRCAADYAKLIPEDLPEKFTSAEFAKAAKIRRPAAQRALNILSMLDVITHIGKRGRSYEYSRIQNE